MTQPPYDDDRDMPQRQYRPPLDNERRDLPAPGAPRPPLRSQRGGQRSSGRSARDMTERFRRGATDTFAAVRDNVRDRVNNRRGGPDPRNDPRSAQYGQEGYPGGPGGYPPPPSGPGAPGGPGGQPGYPPPPGSPELDPRSAYARAGYRERTSRQGMPGGPGGPTGPGGPGGPGGPPGPPRRPGGPEGPDGRRPGEGPKSRKKKKLRRRILLLVVAFFVFSVCGTLGVVYAAAHVPLPGELKLAQSSTIYFSDCTTPMGKIGTTNRSDVKLTKVPKFLQHEVLSAEDRTFYENSGFSPTGLMRAAWANVTGGLGSQGGSTITQQYVKNTYLAKQAQQKTLGRKFKELILSIKVDNNYSKDQILEWYLNTIYWGRNAYGIEAASEAYFNTSVDKLNASQGALLAAMIRNPYSYNPKVSLQRATDRWNYVLDGMVKKGWLSQTERAQQQFPQVIDFDPNKNDFSQKTPYGYIVKQVKAELAAHGFSDEYLTQNSLKICTTIDKKTEDQAIATVQSTFQKADAHDAEMRQALVAIKPGDGAVMAYYGGTDGTTADEATQPHMPGSSFKPYTIMNALKNGYSIDSKIDASSPADYPDRGANHPVHNSGNGNYPYPQLSMTQAAVKSLNSAFYGLAEQPDRYKGPPMVAKIAGDFGVKKMGIRSQGNDKPHNDPIESSGPKIQSGEIGIGNIYTRVIDQATGFATLAARGMEADPYFIAKVINTADDKVAYQATPKTHKVTTVTQDMIDDTTYVLQQVLHGTSNGQRELAPGPHNEPRPAAVKTGTTQFDTTANLDAWMVGYTPQLATAVWTGYDHFKELKDEKGAPIYGAGLPGMAWKAFMDQALKGQPVKKFADPAHVGDDTKGMGKSGAVVQGGGGDNNGGDNNGGNNGTVKCTFPGFPVGCQGGNDGGNQGGGNNNGGGNNSPTPTPTSTCNLLDPRCRQTH